LLFLIEESKPLSIFIVAQNGFLDPVVVILCFLPLIAYFLLLEFEVSDLLLS
jgi:hypothetical protein